MSKVVFISGSTGQLGAFLCKLYLEKGYKVIGGIRRSANFNPWRLKHFELLDKITFEYFDLADQGSIDRVIEKYKPDLFINAAAQSFVGNSWEIGVYTLDVTGVGVYRCLESIKKFSPHTKFLQMSSSELFGNNPDYPYNEKSIFMPRSPYAIAKAVGFHSVVNFRESYKLFASNLISFNFESPLRGEEFVTKKIVKEAARVHNEWQCGKPITPLRLGNLDPTRDWIWAGDTARAIELILDHNKPDDFCIASGVTTSVREFCTKAFAALGHKLEWETIERPPLIASLGYPVSKFKSKYPNLEMDVLEIGKNEQGDFLVESRESLYRPADVPHLIGDAQKAFSTLGWKPTKNLDQIIEEMVDFERKKYL